MNPAQTWLYNKILSGEVGSVAHGTAVNGQDDKDIMGVFVETQSQVFRPSPCDHYTWRTRNVGERSGPGDVDFVAYSLRRYCNLALAGNATVILLMWLPPNRIEYDSPIGNRLINMREKFISKDCGRKYLGYLRSQRDCLHGKRKPKTQRPELVEKYGYDTKFAMHALRLGLQGVEMLTKHHLTIPVPKPDLDILRQVREGKVNYVVATELIDDAERRLAEAVDRCDLEADAPAIERFLIDAHQSHWQTEDATRF